MHVQLVVFMFFLLLDTARLTVSSWLQSLYEVRENLALAPASEFLESSIDLTLAKNQTVEYFAHLKLLLSQV